MTRNGVGAFAELGPVFVAQVDLYAAAIAAGRLGGTERALFEAGAVQRAGLRAIGMRHERPIESGCDGAF